MPAWFDKLKGKAQDPEFQAKAKEAAQKAMDKRKQGVQPVTQPPYYGGATPGLYPYGGAPGDYNMDGVPDAYETVEENYIDNDGNGVDDRDEDIPVEETQWEDNGGYIPEEPAYEPQSEPPSYDQPTEEYSTGGDSYGGSDYSSGGDSYGGSDYSAGGDSYSGE